MNRLARLMRLLVVLVVALAPLSVANASVTAGAIKGTTIDEGGLPIPGVLITIRSEKMIGGAQQRTTDSNGRFAFFELPPGDYELTAEKAGFAKIVKPNLLVIIGRNTQLTIEMPLKTAGAELVVEEDRPTIDTEQASRGEVLSKEFLQSVPTGRSYQSAVQSAPGVTGGSNPNVAGSGYNENTYMLDGINITDPVTGTFSLNFNFDAIEQLEVLTGAFDPEYGESLGGLVNIVTETGGNTLQFDTSLWYKDGDWAPKIDARISADGYEMSPTGFDSQYDTLQVNAKLSGPVIRDRAWFIASYQYTRTLIANVGIDLPRDYDGHYLLSKLTMQPSAAHRFTIVGFSDPTTIDNTDQSDRFVKPEAQGRQAQGGYVASLQWDWFLSPQAFMETKATVNKTYIEVYGVPCTHIADLGYHPCEEDEAENYLDFKTPGRLGTYNAFDSGNYGYFYFDDRFRFNLTSKFSLLQVDIGGTHDFKAGFDLDHLVWDQIVGYNGDLLIVDLNEVSYAPSTFQNYYWYEITGPYHMNTSGQHVGAFLQDVYKPIDNLTFRYGVRYDRSVQRNAQGEPVVDVGLWGPRFYTAWDPWGDGKTKVVGGYGRFNDTGRLAVASFNSQANTFGYKMFLGEYFGGYSNLTTDAYYEYDGVETDYVWDNTTAPHVDEVSFGGQREVIQDMAAGVFFTGKFTKNIYDYDESNLIWDEDGYNVVGASNGQLDSIYRMRTPDIARRDYYQTDLQLKKNYADRWQMLATYSYVVSQGTVQTAISGNLVNPQQLEYMYGNLGTDIRHQFKAAGSYALPFDPWTTDLGFNFAYYSGYPLSRYYYGETPGSYGSYNLLKDSRGTYARTLPVWTLDIRVQQAIPVRRGQLWGIVEVTNVFNNRAADSAYVSSYYNRWFIYSRQDPLQVQVAARYTF